VNYKAGTITRQMYILPELYTHLLSYWDSDGLAFDPEQLK